MKGSTAEVEEMRLATTRGVKDAPLPVKYEQARAALAECVNIDECSTWAKKAAALASYARQADDDSLRKMSERIQARAVRRCSELLRQLPAKARGTGKAGVEAPPHLLSERARAAEKAGMSRDQVVRAMRVGKIPEAEFEALVESDDPPTLTELAERGTRKVAPLVDIEGRDPAEFNRAIHVRGAIADLAVMLGHVEPAAIVRGCVSRQLPDLKKNSTRLIAWLSDLVEELESAE